MAGTLAWGEDAKSWTAQDYLQAVLATAPDVAESRESYNIARRQWLSQIGSAALPTVSFTALDYPWGYNPINGYAFNSWRLNRDDMSFNTTFNWNVFNSFKDYESVKFASWSKESALQSWNAARQSRALAALAAFYDLHLKEQVLEENRQNLAAEDEQYRVTKDLYHHGLKSLADLLKSETDLRSSELGVASAEADRLTSLMKFNVLLDQSPDAPAALVAEASPASTEAPPVKQDLGRALGSRPEALKAQADLSRAQTAFVQSIQNNLPTFAANATWNRDDQASFGVPSSSLGIRNPNYYVGLSLTLPLGFNLFSQTQNVLASKADKRRLAQVLRDVDRQVVQDVYSAFIQLDAALKAYRIATLKEDIAKRSLDLVVEQYRQSTADAIRLSQAQLDYLNARVQRSQALHDASINRAQYRLAIGEPLWK